MIGKIQNLDLNSYDHICGKYCETKEEIFPNRNRFPSLLWYLGMITKGPDRGYLTDN